MCSPKESYKDLLDLFWESCIEGELNYLQIALA